VKRRRVLQVLGHSAGGIARHVAQIVAALDRSGGLVVDVAAPPDNPVSMPKALYPIRIPDGPLGHAPAIGRLRTLVEAGGYDIVHAHGLRAGIDCGIAARSTGRRPLVTVHNLVRPEVSGRSSFWAYRWTEPLVVALSQRVFAVSDDAARSLRSLAPRLGARVETLHLGVGPAPAVGRAAGAVRAELEVGEGENLVVTAARLQPQKALHVLLEAIAESPAVVLALLGEGPLEGELRAAARALGVSERVRWLGFRSDVADFIAAGDAFCLSSRWEGVPLAAQEAILLGTVVVATGVGGMPELVLDGRTGRLVPPDDPPALAGALREVLASPALRAEYAERAREHLMAEFSTEAMLGRLRSAYEDAG
jgi:glycosyltransferase involved in cell wall biosynthesis